MKVYQVWRHHVCIFQAYSYATTKEYLLEFMQKYDSYYVFDVDRANDDKQLQWACVCSESCSLKVIYIVQHETSMI